MVLEGEIPPLYKQMHQLKQREKKTDEKGSLHQIQKFNHAPLSWTNAQKFKLIEFVEESDTLNHHWSIAEVPLMYR